MWALLQKLKVRLPRQKARRRNRGAAGDLDAGDPARAKILREDVQSQHAP